MSEAVQIALQTVLKGVSGLADEGGREHVTRGDTTVLDVGFTKMIIIEPGSFSSDDAAACQIKRTWNIPIDLIYRYTNDGETMRNLVAFRGAVINHLDTHPTLSNAADITVQRLSSEEPEGLYDKAGGGPYFMAQTINVEIIERVTLSGGEYA